MTKISIKNKIAHLLLVPLLVSVVNITLPIANAGYNPTPRNICSLAVFPFNIDSQVLLGAAGDPFINKLTNEACLGRVVPANANPYSPQPPPEALNPVKAGAENKNVPRAKHFHKYYNDSVDNDGYFYQARMKQFEIIVESDGFASVKRGAEDIACGLDVVAGDRDINGREIQENDSPDDIELGDLSKCDGTVDGIWGGTRVTRTNVCATPNVAFANCAENQKNVKILFEFGLNNAAGMPKIWGNNDDNHNNNINNFGTVGDLSNAENFGRNIEFFVDLESKNNDSIWSATTTSRALIVHRGIKKSNYPDNEASLCADNNVNTAGNGWCYLATPAGNPAFTTQQVNIRGTNRTFHWFPIGSVATVWKEKPPVPSECISLSAELTGETERTENNDIAREIAITNLDYDGDIPRGSNFQWNSTDEGGTFYLLVNNQLEEIGDSSALTIIGQRNVYYAGSGTVTVALNERGANGRNALTCRDEVVLPPPVILCSKLEAVEGQSVQIANKTGHKLSVTQNGITLAPLDGELPATYRLMWTTIDPTGKFYSKNGNDFVQLGPIGGPAISNLVSDVYYVEGDALRSKVTVTVAKPDNARPGQFTAAFGGGKACFDDFRFEHDEEIPPVCEELKVDHPTNIFEQTLSSFTGQSIDNQDPAQPFNEGKIRYSVDPGFGSFFKVKPNLQPENQSEIIFETFDISTFLDILNNSWDFNLFNNRRAENGMFAFDPSQGMASNFIPRRPIGPDLSGAIDESIFDPITPERPIEDALDFGIQFPVTESIDVNSGEQVWFFGEQASNGVNVIHVDQLNAQNQLVAACQRDFPIIPFSVCDALKVNHDAIINEGKVTTFTAKALDEQGRNFKGRITYSVDEGKGRFFLVDPGLTNNVSQRITEGVVANQPIAEPAGGFCGVKEKEISLDNGNINWGAVLNNAIIDVPAIEPREDEGNGAGGNGAVNIYAQVLPSSALFQLKDYELINLTSNIANGNYYKPSNTIDLTDRALNLVTPKSIINTKFKFNTQLGNNVFNIGEIVRRAQDNNSYPNLIQLNRENLNDRFNLNVGDFIREQSLTSVTVDPGTQVWFLPENVSDEADGRNVIHVETTCTEVGGCKRDFSITPGQNICQDFGMTVVPSDQLAVDQDATINLEPRDQEGNPLPEDTNIIITNTTGGQVLPGAIAVNHPNVRKLSQFPATLENTTQAGTVTLSVDPTDPSFALACQGQITVTKDIAPECKALTYVIKEYFDGNQTDVLSENNMYQVSANVDVIGEVPNPAVDYSIPADYGTFVTLAEGPIGVAQSFGIKSLIINDNLSRASLEAAGFDTGSPVTAPELEAVYFVIFTDTPAVNGLTPNILKMSADGFGNIECQKSVPLKKDQKEEVKECIDLEIVNPERPWEIDNSDEDATQLFQIRVRSNPEDFKNDLFYHWEVTAGGGEWQDGDNTNDTLVDAGDTTKILENFDEETEVDVYATATKNGDKIAECSDSISTTVEKEKKKPKVSKYVYPEGKVDDKDNIINIGETRNTRFVTYMIAFTPADSASVEIWEDSMENNKIQSNGSLNGNLELEEMSINILSENDSRSYAFMRSNPYHEDQGDSSYADENFDYNEDREIFCDEDIHNKLCIDNADDVAEVMQKFGDGEPIKFKNLGDLDDGDQIIIKYRVANNSKVDNEVCKTLATDNGCGEEFDNTIRFKAYEDNNFDNEFENGRDSAKVIVICPYVITRGGGDSFFHDIIDTGADVAQCSEVKSCEGACIKPPREKPRDIPKTGTGDIDKGLSLTLPSHDICKYSNSKDNIEGYNDVLKNFSSTVCEVESEVAAIWKEKNINNAIAANIERLARFGSNLNAGELNTDVDNKESGVFISDGEDITIGTNGTYTIEGGSGLPAAQTYIVRNADLHIKSNIVYGSTDFNDQTNIPSAAFIVIDGNIIIDNDVSRLDGIYMAVDLDKSDDGKVTNGNSNEDSQTALSIYGNLIGNVYELFATRKGYGDPTKDEGSVVIHYDSRILLNTPPGISDLIDIDQSLIPG